jgi:hypothetical protein
MAGMMAERALTEGDKNELAAAMACPVGAGIAGEQEMTEAGEIEAAEGGNSTGAAAATAVAQEVVEGTVDEAMTAAEPMEKAVATVADATGGKNKEVAAESELEEATEQAAAPLQKYPCGCAAQRRLENF